MLDGWLLDMNVGTLNKVFPQEKQQLYFPYTTILLKFLLFYNSAIAGFEKFHEITKFSSYYLSKLLGQRNCILCWHCNCNNEKSFSRKVWPLLLHRYSCTPRYYLLYTYFIESLWMIFFQDTITDRKFLTKVSNSERLMKRY